MSTSLHRIFCLVFGIVYLVRVISNIRGRKKRFSKSSQNFLLETSIFGQFEVIFRNL